MHILTCSAGTLEADYHSYSSIHNPGPGLAMGKKVHCQISSGRQNKIRYFANNVTIDDEQHSVHQSQFPSPPTSRPVPFQFLVKL